ncbi:MAG: 3-hydroxyacyl-CoA dehydrogenase family protein [Anaerolineae bacterium]
MDIKTIGVIGCGLMGSGICEVVARAGYEVIVTEANQELLDNGLSRIQKSLARGVSRQKLSQAEAEATQARIRATLDMAEMAACDLVVEAIIEKMEVKLGVFRQLDEICRPETILASNTSSLNVTSLAGATKRPAQVLGTHFFNPVPVMPLLEIVRALTTSEETLAAVTAWGESLGKTIVVAKDSPGFIVNRLLVPYLIDAIRVYDQGLASREDIDNAMKLGASHPMGPLTLSDYVGLDTLLLVAEVLYEEYGEPRLLAPPLLRRMVTAGHLGRKSGKGFYDYT